MKSEYIHTAIGVIGVIVNAEYQVLLVLSKDRGWEPPMGFVEPNESPLLALQREVLEESGYSVNVTRLTGVYHTIKDEMPILSLCFLCAAGELVSADVKESLAVQWVDKEKLKEFISYQPHLLRVGDALQDEHVFFREYQIQPFSVSHSWLL